MSFKLRDMTNSKGSEAKKRVIVDYKNVTSEFLDLFTDRYPYGYDDSDIIGYKNAKDEMIEAVPFETQGVKYLVKIGLKMDQYIENFLDNNNDDPLTGDAAERITEKGLEE